MDQNTNISFENKRGKKRLLGNNLERVLDEDESRAIKATSTADEMNGCFLISSIGSNQRVGVEMITRQEKLE